VQLPIISSQEYETNRTVYNGFEISKRNPYANEESIVKIVPGSQFLHQISLLDPGQDSIMYVTGEVVTDFYSKLGMSREKPSTYAITEKFNGTTKLIDNPFSIVFTNFVI
jgi:hypothetical protein